MLRRFVPIALAVALATAPLAAQATQAKTAAPTQAAKLTGLMAAVQGVWQMTSANGQDTAGSGQEMTVTITDNKYARALNGQVVERGTFKLDESKKPVAIDITITEGDDAGQTQVGVMELTGKTMNGKLGQPGGTTRPTDFTIAEGFFTFTMVKK